MVIKFGKLILLAPLVLGVFLAYSIGSWFALNHVFAYEYPRPYLHMVGESVIGALIVSVLFSYPLRKIYKNKAYLAGLVGCSGVLALRLPDVIDYWSKDLDIVIMGIVEPASIISCLMVGILIVSKRVGHA